MQSNIDHLMSVHFKTEKDLLKFGNDMIKNSDFKIITIIFKDVTNGDWIIFYII